MFTKIWVDTHFTWRVNEFLGIFARSNRLVGGVLVFKNRDDTTATPLS